LHDELLAALKYSVPDLDWIANARIAELQAAFNLDRLRFGHRAKRTFDMISGFDIILKDHYSYIENGNLEELNYDLDAYRQYHSIPSNEKLVLLVALKHNSICALDYHITGKADMIVNTDRMTMEQITNTITKNHRNI
jgi:hypothetical protein